MRDIISRHLREKINKENRGRLKNHTFSLIASNCNGAFISHDLGLKFRIPFVNLWVKPKDFLKYLYDILGYMQSELQFGQNEGYSYPVGELKDIKIYFKHYHSEKEAEEKWRERSKRMNLNNLFILFTDRDGCTYEDLLSFDNLPYKNKVVFTRKEYKEIRSSVYIPGYEQRDSVGNCFEYINCFSGKRRYDVFDYVTWFNEGKG